MALRPLLSPAAGSPPDIKSNLRRRESRRAANNRASKLVRPGKGELLVGTFECACECVSRDDCEETFMVERQEFWRIRGLGQLVMAPRHWLFDLERQWGQHEGWVEVAAPNPTSGSLDINTLKDHADFLRPELAAARVELAAVNGRIATSIVTAALVISLFATLLPEDLNRLAVLLVLGGLAVFLRLLWIALIRPQDIEESWIASGKAPAEAMRYWAENPIESVKDAPLGIESYEQWHRMEMHRAPTKPYNPTWHHFAEAQLPETDYLVEEVNRLRYMVAQFTQRIGRARSVLKEAYWWMSGLVVYLIVLVVVVRLL